MNLPGDVIKHIMTFLEDKSVHHLSLTCKQNAMCAKHHFNHPYRKGSLIYMQRFGYWTYVYRVLASNERFVYLQRVIWSATVGQFLDSGEQMQCKPVRYLNPLAKYSFIAAGALKHGEWTVRSTGCDDIGIGRLLKQA